MKILGEFFGLPSFSLAFPFFIEKCIATFITLLAYLIVYLLISKKVRTLKREFTYNLQQIYIAIGTCSIYYDRQC